MRKGSAMYMSHRNVSTRCACDASRCVMRSSVPITVLQRSCQAVAPANTAETRPLVLSQSLDGQAQGRPRYEVNAYGLEDRVHAYRWA